MHLSRRGQIWVVPHCMWRYCSLTEPRPLPGLQSFKASTPPPQTPQHCSSRLAVPSVVTARPTALIGCDSAPLCWRTPTSASLCCLRRECRSHCTFLTSLSPATPRAYGGSILLSLYSLSSDLSLILIPVLILMNVCTRLPVLGRANSTL